MSAPLDTRLLRYRNDPSREDPKDFAEALLAEDRTQDALEVVGRALKAQPNDATLRLLAGRAWLAEGELLRAQKMLLQAARVLSDEPEPFRWLGEVLLKRGEPARAAKVLARAAALGAAGPEFDALRARARRLSQLVEAYEEEPYPKDGAGSKEEPPKEEPAEEEPAKREPTERLGVADLELVTEPPAAAAPPAPPAAAFEEAAEIEFDDADSAPEGEEERSSSASYESLPVKLPVRRPWLRVGILLGLIACLGAGGYVGFQYWQGEQRTRAQTLLRAAEEAAWRCDPVDLESARDQLDQAARLDAEGAREVALTVAALSLIEDGVIEDGAVEELRSVIDAAPEGALRQAAALWLESWEGAGEEARLSAALSSVEGDAAAAYLLARAALRAGDTALAARALSQASEAEPTFVCAQLASAELAILQEDLDAARSIVGDALTQAPGHLRATLWQLALTPLPEGGSLESRTLSLARPQRQLKSLHDAIADAGPTAAALEQLTLARLARGRGEAGAAFLERGLSQGRDAIAAAALTRVSREAVEAGELALAERAIEAAIAQAPGVSSLRVRHAEILTAQGEGSRALAILSALPAGEGRTQQLLLGETALKSGELDAIVHAFEQLEAVGEEALSDPALAILKLRLQLRARPGTVRVEEAQALAEANAESRVAQLALAETMIAQGDAAQSYAILAPLAQALASEATPDAAISEASLLHLLARAQLARAEDPSEALDRALHLQPGNRLAQLARAQYQLKVANSESSEEAFNAALEALQGILEGMGDAPAPLLSGADAAELARLESARALAERGRFEEASAQLEALPEEAQSAAPALLLSAQLQLDQGHTREALALLEAPARAVLGDHDARDLQLAVAYAHALLVDDKRREARTLLEAISAAHPDAIGALLGRAEIMVEVERHDVVQTLLEEAEAQLSARANEGVGAAIDQGLRAQALMLRGRIAIDQGASAIARPALREAARSPGAPVEAWFYLGESLAGAQVAEARAAYETYLLRAPGGRFATRARRAIQ